MEHLSGVIAPQPQLKVTGKVKTFVLDTNVLLHDPQSIFKFEDNNLAIPVEVLEELDAIKSEQSTERGRNARRVHRILQELLPDSRSMLEGVKLPNGGTLSVIINRYLVEGNRASPAMQRLRAILPDLTKKDNCIIACALFVQETFPAADDPGDQGRQCAAQGPRGRPRIPGLSERQGPGGPRGGESTANSGSRLRIAAFLPRRASLTLGRDEPRPLAINEYVLLRSDEGKTMPARYYGDSIVRRLKIPEFVKAPGGIPIRARNLEQQFLMDALLDESIAHHLLRQGGHGQNPPLDRVRAPPGLRRAFPLRRRVDLPAGDLARQGHRLPAGHA